MSSEAGSITREQKKAFIAAWLGWAFDGLEGFLYTLVALPFVASLMSMEATNPQVPQHAAIIQAVFLFGWAIGGAVFGRIGDKIGRTKTLTITILTYAIFTGASYFVQTWWQLMIVRFIAALGIGGEWAAGSALVSESLHDKHRSWASALLQSGYMTGIIMAAVTVRLMSGLDHRYVFLVGIIPALLTLWIRKSIHEPAEWQAQREKRELPKISTLFSKQLRRNTILALSYCSLCLTTVWAFLYFNTQILRGLPEVQQMSKADADILISNVTIIFTLWNIVGNFAATYLAKFIGVKKAFAFFMVTAFIVFYFGYSKERPLSELTLWYNATMFFSTGVFAIFPLYLPKLFPTLLRTTGAGFCYNFGRIIAALGTLLMPMLIAGAGSKLNVLWYTGFLYIPGILIAFLMPEVEDIEHADPELLTE